MEIKINDYYEPDHFRAISEDNYNISRTCEYEKNEMHHIHNTSEILLVEDGAADYYISGRKYHVEPYDILVIGAMEHHLRRIDRLLRLSWNFGSLYTLRNDRRVIAANRQLLNSNRDVFLFNTRLQATQQGSAVESVRRQMADDDEIIRLRTSIRKASEAKVANGTMTVTDMLRDMTSENLARQTKALHEVQLLMNMYQLKYTTNN